MNKLVSLALFATAVTFLMISRSYAAPLTIQDISSHISTELTRIPARLPLINSRPSPYYDELHFTIIALSTHSFADLFAPSATAHSIFTKWQNNVYADYSLDSVRFGDLKAKVGAVLAVLDSTESYKQLTFADLVDRRLRDTLVSGGMQDLELALNNLVKAHFQFPLFRKLETGVTVDDILILLERICQKHLDVNKDDGGLGNLTWYQLFYTPADPTCFTKEKINNTIAFGSGMAKIQGNILPSPNEKFKVFIQSEFDDFLEEAASNDLCCCNFQADHPLHFRKCAPMSGSNCDLCGGTYCCLAGVQWCPNTMHPYPYP